MLYLYTCNTVDCFILDKMCIVCIDCFKQLWQYQIWTGEWKLLKTHGEVPTQLASHHGICTSRLIKVSMFVWKY